MTRQFHLKTPLIRSHELSILNSKENEVNVYLKLETIQPTGSFKIRGIGNLISKKFESGTNKIIASSGGNAGLAAAYTSSQLGINSTIFVPKTTSEAVISKLKSYDANVIIHGSVWDETDLEARQVAESQNATYVSPFDHELIWEGNSTLIDEIKEQMGDKIPDCIIASVGGGGLMIGLIEGLIKNGWMEKEIKLIAVESRGADCFSESIKQQKLITLDSIQSVCKSLGAKTCSKKLFEYYNQFKDKIESIVLEDKEAVLGSLNLLNDHRILTEPACGVSVQVAYNLKKYLNKNYSNVVVVVCGGSGTKLESLIEMKNQFIL